MTVLGLISARDLGIISGSTLGLSIDP